MTIHPSTSPLVGEDGKVHRDWRGAGLLVRRTEQPPNQRSRPECLERRGGRVRDSSALDRDIGARESPECGREREVQPHRLERSRTFAIDGVRAQRLFEKRCIESR